MIFDLYYISCTYVKPMNCMVLGNKQYNTKDGDSSGVYNGGKGGGASPLIECSTVLSTTVESVYT